MHVFVTGATGWVGSVVVKDLIGAGYRVTGLARSEQKAKALAETGAQVLPGTLDDLDVLKRSAAEADAVIHTAFNHDFSRFAENAEQDRRAIEAFGEALAGTGKPLLVTSGLAMLTAGRPATEADVPAAHPGVPRKSEATARMLAARGVRAATVRLPPSTHGVGDQGFMAILMRLAREKGLSAYIGEGANRWAATHRDDAGRIYRLALEQGATEAAYHPVAEEGIAFRDIAQAIGKKLGLPVEPREPAHFGWFAGFAAMDMSASSARTRELLGWTPTQPGLLADLGHPDYFKA
jgi:nucleoside-diphosphate-sugar epimerase